MSMDISRKAVPLVSVFIVCMFLQCILSLACSAQQVDESSVSASSILPVTQYCNGIADRINKQWTARTADDNGIVIQIALDQDGNIQSIKPWEHSKGSPEQIEKATSVVTSLKNLGTPPANWSPVILRMEVCAAHGIEVSKDNIDLGSYMNNLQRKVIKSWTPAKRERLRAVVTFTQNRDGSVSDVQLDRSSKDESTDKAALDAVRDGAPYGTMPDGAPPHVNVQFALDDAAKSRTQSSADTPSTGGAPASAERALLLVDVSAEASGMSTDAPAELAAVFSRAVEAKLAERKDLFEVHDRDTELLLLDKNPDLKLKGLDCLIRGTIIAGGSFATPEKVSVMMADMRIVDVSNSQILGVASAEVKPKKPLLMPTETQLSDANFAKSELGQVMSELATQLADQFATQAPNIAERLGKK